MSNPLPLTRPQLVALFGAVARELGHGLRAVTDEVATWRRHAASIPDERLRADALHALDSKRGHIDGAALFWTLPSRRDLGLLRVLVAYELIQDYLDGLSERATRVGAAHASRPFLALGDALTPERPVTDYYEGLPWNEDNGYLAALVHACRQGVRALPSFRAVRPHLVHEVRHAHVLHLNHIRDPLQRDAALRTWAGATFEADHGLQWYEVTAAASGWVTTHALLALAAEPGVSDRDVLTTHAAYFPHVALTLTLLDSWADQAQDARTGDHNYLSHYPTTRGAVLRLCASIDHSARDVLALPHGERHAVLLACMIALYMSKDSARQTAVRRYTRRIVRAGGALTRMLLPVLRLWRILNAQKSAT
jgi:tetraprenyl-beta-curcumene synthase